MNMFNILLVEDDTESCRNCIQEIHKFEELYLVNTTNCSHQAIEDIKNYSPDAIILDLELSNGSGSGIDVLKYIQTCNSRPYVMVVTNNPSMATHNIVRALGADFIMYKQQENFSELQVISFLYDLMEIIKKQKNVSRAKDKLPSASDNQKILDAICTELTLIGISTKHKGFNYLKDAIYIAIVSSQDNIATQLAKKYKKTEISIIRAMRYAIEFTWNNQDIDRLETHYKGSVTSDKGCPTITEFISYYSQSISSRLV